MRGRAEAAAWRFGGDLFALTDVVLKKSFVRRVPGRAHVWNEFLEKEVGRREGGSKQEITHTFLRIKRRNLLLACFLIPFF